jgi:hypothetical protein
MTSDMRPLFEGIRLMTMSAVNRGAVAAVIDGACRDVEEIRKLKFPVLCKGFVPNVAAVSGYGHVNVPIQCAGVAVSPGDVVVVDGTGVVVVDGNGVVVVPRGESATVLDQARQLLRTEHVLQDRIRAGATIGQLVDVDDVFRKVFAYQDRAVARSRWRGRLAPSDRWPRRSRGHARVGARRLTRDDRAVRAPKVPKRPIAILKQRPRS